MKIVLMRGNRKIASVDVSFEKATTVLWDEFDGAKRKSVFDYSHTTSRGKVYRERTTNKTSLIITLLNEGGTK